MTAYTFNWQHKYSVYMPKTNQTKRFDSFKELMDFYMSNKDIFMNPKRNF